MCAPGPQKVAMLVAAAAFSLVLVGCDAWPSEPIVIGYMGGLSGRSAGLGVAGRNGVTLAVEEINAAGGLDGRQIKLVVHDDGPGDEASRQGVEALRDQGARIIIGPMTSSSASASVPVAEQLKIAMLSPTVTSTDFTGKDDFFIRVCPDNRAGSRALATEAIKRFGIKRTAVVVDDGNASFTRTFARYFRDGMESRGGRVTTETAFVSGQNADYSILADAAMATRPDSVLVIANPIDSAMICQRLRIAGFDGRLLLSPWSVSSDDFLSKGGEAVEGAMAVDMCDSGSSSPERQVMYDAFVARFGAEPNFAAMLAYDATQLVIEVMRTEGAESDLREGLIELDPWEGFEDVIDLDEFGDVDRPFYAKVVRNGRFVRLLEP